ncbi:PAH-inducible cytochrome P450 monooxygenase PC-PAH 4 [Cylindrobasidium torrendii FP15055 ss-10]|uniref:PAH-inducible cytochrome P450 monooxygenase PC-PAH 4 n=1 Tax=Cylindrobasidium torrendii FP15055 ss-10 TaxID=1314674 RepID=A0A0D7B8J7_9AGAR|nr:PAH-inducible cytochrome P450 monooxygenase PC-PAH 4 [Cylindrobasidium torrendii FP15055 ss-10]
MNQEQAGDLEFAWFKKYGATYKIKGTFGEDILMTSDAKALQYIIRTCAYKFDKAQGILISALASSGRGVLAVNGTTHQRHRKVLSPAFSETQLRSYIPLFRRVGKTLITQMRNAIDEPGKRLDMHMWFGRASLDVVGEAMFAYKFNSLEDEASEMAEIMDQLMDGAATMSKTLRVGLWVLENVPALQVLVDYSPAHLHRRLLQFKKLAKGLAKRTVDEAMMEASVDEQGKDMLSILVRANQNGDMTKKLSEDEVLSQASAILGAGQETTTSTLTWLFYELAQHQDVQDSVRREIAAVRARVGESPFTTQDYDGMEMLNAVIKETLRFHPILGVMSRQAYVDEVIPLGEPIITADGQRIDHIPVKKGQLIECAAHGYNRNLTVWGPDAHTWRPERWSKKLEHELVVGIHGNVMTFSGGVRGCLGWRFAVMSMQSLTAEVLENFRFAPSEDTKLVRRRPGLLITPRLQGRFQEGIQMPLSVTPL